jgi:crossover junction endodeoxyribonuclease RuvC
MMPLSYPTKKPTISMDAAWSWLDPYPGPKAGFIENVHAMPRQGVSSSFQFGRMFGGAELVLQSTCLRVFHVTPQAWKKHFGLGSDKNASIAMATLLFGTDQHWKLKKHEGVAEAALIALYGLGQI